MLGTSRWLEDVTLLRRVEGAMSAPVLGQYFRSFLIKLSMVESQLGQLGLGGMSVRAQIHPDNLTQLMNAKMTSHLPS